MGFGIVRHVGLRLAVAVVVAGVASFGVFSVGPEGGAQVVRATVAVPAIDLGFLSDDENEPDEDEPNENGPDGQPQKVEPTEHAAAVPRWLVYTIAGVALVLVVGTTVLIVRCVRRYRAWKRRMAIRTRVWMRRLGDDLERARRRGFRS
jgi:hypothetical protein